MSSSESEEDENIKKIAAAVDVNLFNDMFYTPKKKDQKESSENCKEEQKSQRYLQNDENVFHSELNVSDQMKNFIGNKMSKIIEESIEFVDVIVNSKKKKSQKDYTRLLNGYEEYVKMDQEIEIIPQIKIPIKRRKMMDEIEKFSECDKLHQAAITLEKINEKYNTKNRHKVIKFKQGKDGKYHMEDEINEYTATRIKNNWNESKIKDARNYGRSLNKILLKN